MRAMGQGVPFTGFLSIKHRKFRLPVCGVSAFINHCRTDRTRSKEPTEQPRATTWQCYLHGDHMPLYCLLILRPHSHPLGSPMGTSSPKPLFHSAPLGSFRGQVGIASELILISHHELLMVLPEGRLKGMFFQRAQLPPLQLYCL